MSMIRTANQQPLLRRREWLYRQFIERLVRERWGASVNWTVAGTPVQAWINRSDWVVNCDGCRESVIAEPGEPFYCPNCENAANGYQARPVEWPSERAEIERLLLLRPNPENRTWLTSETPDDLRAENLEHGIEV